MLKKLLLLTFVILTTMFNLYATENTERIDLTIDKQTVTAEDRTCIYSIDAYHSRLESCITIECYGLKTAQIYILDAYGNTINYTSHYFSEESSSVQLDGPTLKGNYFLIIESPVAYAYGTFSIIK